MVYAGDYVDTTVSTSVFRDVLQFFERLGIYDVILPFLLVFTIVFAIFERTRVFGTEVLDGHQVTKKNLNAMVAFVIAFLVVASSQLVAIINETMSSVVILMLVLVSFLVLIGTFFSEKEEVILKDGWRLAFMVAVLVGVILIFAHAIPYNGEPFLNWLFNYILYNYNDTVVSSIIMIIVVLVFVGYIVKEPKSAKPAAASGETKSH